MAIRFKQTALIAVVGALGVVAGLTLLSAAIAPESPALTDLETAQAQLAAARLVFQEYPKGKKELPSPYTPLDVEFLHSVSDRILTAELELSANQAERLAAFKGHLERITEIELMIQRANSSWLRWNKPILEYFRVDAERRLARVKSK